MYNDKNASTQVLFLLMAEYGDRDNVNVVHGRRKNPHQLFI